MNAIKKMSAAATGLLSLLFPRRRGGVDFSRISGEEILRTSPRSRDLTAPRFPPGCRAALSYKYPRTRALIWQIKYKKDAAAMRIGGYILQSLLADFIRERRRIAAHMRSGTPVIVIPMPISPARRRERGYNQCELLAKAMLPAHQAYSHEHIDVSQSPAQTTTILENDTIGKNDRKVLISNTFEIRTDILLRPAHTERQTLKNRAERLRNARDIFAIHKPIVATILADPVFRTRTVVVIDDVITTGSTMHQAITTLQNAGFTDVNGLIVAH